MFKDKKTTLLFYVFVFLFTMHITPAIYVNANFLAQFLSTQQVSLIYLLGSVGTILAIVGMRPHLKRFGNYRMFFGSLIIEMIALLLVILSNSILAVVISFVTIFIVQSTMLVNMDIFLERNTPNDFTGKIRGWFFTAMNLAFIIGPFISSILLGNGDFKQVYVFVLLLLFPVLFMASELFKDFQDAPYDRVNFVRTFVKIRQNPDLYATCAADFILKFFYGWMVIYMPIYLYDHMHFTLAETSLILSIALIPFVLIQGTAGKLADTKYGEKEMLSIGFLVIAVFTALLSFIDSPNISVWIAALFMTRVGASMVEIMTETHLFKRIDSGDLSVISFFRLLRPSAYIAGTAAGSLFLYFISFNMLFFVLGGITLYGLRYSLAITDTR